MAQATGVGSMPGTDFAESLKIVLDKLPDLPHLPELPDRGVESAMIGRTLGLIAHLGFDLQPAGWRLTAAGGVDQRRARSRLDQDLDLLEELTQGHLGQLKIQVTGPWTLAATVERPRGDKILGDPGARRELSQALAEAVSEHLVDVRRRVPGAELVVQVDEPALPAVLAGSIASASGLHRHRTIGQAEASQSLGWVYQAITDTSATALTHCCAGDFPIAMIRAAGSLVSLDPRVLTAQRFEELAECLDAKQKVFLGIAPTSITRPWQVRELLESLTRLLEMLGFATGEVSDYLVLTPACGLSASGLSSSGAAELSSSLGAIHSAAQEVGA